MKRKKWLVVVLTVLAMAVSAAAQGEKPAAKSGSRSATYATFKKLIDEYYDAWSTLDPDKAAKYYAKESGLVFFDVAPLKYNGWGEYRQGVKKAFTEVMSSGKLTPMDDLKVTRRGDIVWTTLTFHLSAKPKAGGSMELDARHTAIWEKRGNSWVILHEHISAPLQN